MSSLSLSPPRPCGRRNQDRFMELRGSKQAEKERTGKGEGGRGTQASEVKMLAPVDLPPSLPSCPLSLPQVSLLWDRLQRSLRPRKKSGQTVKRQEV